MALRDFREVPYLPILALNPAEMQALQELTNKGKDLLLPYIHLKSWSVASHVSSSIARVEAAYGRRPFVLDMADPAPGDAEKTRPVFAELSELRDPSGGYANWASFLSEIPMAIPAVQVGSVAQIPSEVDNLYGLGRGLAVHIRKEMLGAFGPLVSAIASRTKGGRDTVFVVDLGRQDRNLLLNQAGTVAIVNAIFAAAPAATVAVSASSFPASFTSIVDQEIFERTHFNGVRPHCASSIIYSDRGSARAERQLGGGGTPAPRIDLAGMERWTFFRSDAVAKEARPAAYIAQAKNAVAHPSWDANLMVWGSQMIQKTAIKDALRIQSQQLAAAARINMHLHQQLYHDDPPSIYDVDEDWSD